MKQFIRLLEFIKLYIKKNIFKLTPSSFTDSITNKKNYCVKNPHRPQGCLFDFYAADFSNWRALMSMILRYLFSQKAKQAKFADKILCRRWTVGVVDSESRFEESLINSFVSLTFDFWVSSLNICAI